MKKTILILMLLLFNVTLSQEESKTTQTISETERIVDKYSSKVADKFNEFIESAGPMAQEGFKVVVKLQIAKGIACLIPLILFIFFIIWMLTAHRKHGLGTDESFFPEVGTILFFLVSIFTTYRAITHLIAPEWYAIQEITNLI